MKVGLIGVNSQFVHSNLALYYLREELPDFCIGEIREFNNNEPILEIFYAITAADYDVVAFSVYLWNKETVLRLISLLKSATPRLIVIVGGPEPTYAPNAFEECDHIVYGALEPVWARLLTAIAGNEDFINIKGLRGDVCFGQEWKFPYRESDLPQLEHKLVYYETSRGCVYHCAFCLSSVEERCVCLPLARVQRELDFFLRHDIPVVKLVDRTFNAPKERGKEILRYLLDHYKPGVTFHFELKGELLDEETVSLLTEAPASYFQVEIGIQSLNDGALADSRRKSGWKRVKPLYEKLIAEKNVHTHFDLIAALPGESYESFGRGFNEVMTVFPHYLQVGFLKLLPGTLLCAKKAEYGYVAENFPPYEVVRSADISCAELGKLKKLDHFVDRFYNSGALRQTLRYAVKIAKGDAFFLFSALAEADDFAAVLNELFPQEEGVYESLLRLDGFQGGGGKVTKEEDRAVNAFLSDKNKVAAMLPHYADYPPKEIYKRIRILHFPVKIEFDAKSEVIAVSPGNTEILLDYRQKGKQKARKNEPQLYVL